MIRWLLADYIKVSNIGSADSNNLYTEADLEASMDKIEVINFHEQKEANGWQILFLISSFLAFIFFCFNNLFPCIRFLKVSVSGVTTLAMC